MFVARISWRIYVFGLIYARAVLHIWWPICGR